MTGSLQIHELRRQYLSGELTVEAVIDRVTKSADADDPAIWITRLSREDLQSYANRLADKDPASLPLYGIPFAIKDNIDLQGVPTTAACKAFAFQPEASASVVERLIKAGAIPIGKANLDQFATGLVGVRSPYGVPGNAFEREMIPGGSSSGSAVAVAKGLVSFALGTDTAGSGRVPAALNHLVGLKPTCGRLSCRGVVPACRSLDCVSIFAATASEAKEVFAIAEGLDTKDLYSRDLPAEPPWGYGASERPRVAVPRDSDLKFFGNAAYEAAFVYQLERMASLGWHIERIDFEPFLVIARMLYEGPWVAERYVAVRQLIDRQPDALHPVTKGIIGEGREILGADTFEALYALKARQQEMAAFWEQFDILATPTVGTTYTIEDLEKDPVSLNANLGYYTNFMNLLDLSAIAVPVGLAAERRPFGITLSAPAFCDELLLQLGDQLQLASENQPLDSATAVPAVAASAPRVGMEARERKDRCLLAVCGAHLSGLPLHHQLTDLGAEFVEQTTTGSCYRLFVLPDTTPAKPGLVRDVESPSSGAVEIEIYSLSPDSFGRFVREIPSPLGIGKVETAAGDWLSGFLAESWAVQDAEEITSLGGWRAYVDR